MNWPEACGGARVQRRDPKTLNQLNNEHWKDRESQNGRRELPRRKAGVYYLKGNTSHARENIADSWSRKEGEIGEKGWLISETKKSMKN